MLKSDQQILRDEIRVLKKLLTIPVTREKKVDRLRDLLKQIDQGNPGREGAASSPNTGARKSS